METGRWQYNSLQMASKSVPRKAQSSGTKKKPARATQSPVTLAVDIGGSGIKAMLLDRRGKPLSEKMRVLTPAIPTPRAVLRELDKLSRQLPGFDRVSVGFCGVTRRGITLISSNLHPLWANFPLQKELEKRWGKPARVANDAAIHGYGAIRGEGVELVLTLGTGLGSSLFVDGRLCPGLELGHHPWHKDKIYEDYLGRRGLDRYGKKYWNKLLEKAITQTKQLFNWDHLYLGGGNTKKINFELPENVTAVSNETGILGGVALWRED
jgi:polyphosphate glucokinase